MQQTVTQLLIVSPDAGGANRLISRLRADGLSLLPAIAGDPGELAALLGRQQWDLLVLFESQDSPLAAVVELLGQYQQEMPVLLVGDEDARRQSLPELYRQGIRDVIAPDREERLSLAIRREVDNAALHREFRLQADNLRELGKRHRLLLSDSPLAIAYLRDGIHLYCNRSYGEIFGYPDADSVATTPFLNLIATSARDRMRELLAEAGNGSRSATLPVLLKDGGESELLLSFTPVEYEGKACLQLTVRKPAGNAEFTAELERVEGQDLLTGLDNRASFIDRIEEAIRVALRQGRFSALVLVRINDFDDIAAAIGRSNANLVLNDIAQYFSSVIVEPFVAGRLEEHVFGLLVQQGDPGRILALCRELQQNVNSRISSAMLSSVELSCAVGMALINAHALNAADLIDRAMLSLEQGLDNAAADRLLQGGDALKHDTGDMLDYLETALREKRFKLQFQPIVGISGNNLRFYEVLLRMLDKGGNEILPGEFLPLATMNGLGEQIDRMVVTMALDFLQIPDAVHRLTINLTDNTVMSRTFLPWLRDQLSSSRLSAERLVIDISEISLHAAPEQAVEFCRGLDLLGVRLTLSNFGGVPEPFGILDRIRPEFVTLDDAIVRDVIYSSQQQSSVESFVRALHARELQVVAPRVEDMAVLPVLWELGVDYVQGYCLQAPSNEMNYDFVEDEEITLSAPPQ